MIFVMVWHIGSKTETRNNIPEKIAVRLKPVDSHPEVACGRFRMRYGGMSGGEDVTRRLWFRLDERRGSEQSPDGFA